jgi:hypothetical protein
MQPRRRTAGGTDGYEAVETRALAAIENARRTVPRSIILKDALQLQRDPEGLLGRCAWCGRYSLGSEWMDESDLPSVSRVGRTLHKERITHSICPACINVRY